MSNRLLLIIIGLLVANLVVDIVKSPTDTTSVADDGSIGLVRPWFIDEALASDDRSARAVADIADEAGISAYVKTPTAINLALADDAFTSITTINSNYILGTITPPGYSAYWGAQVMVHRTGWIMAWYHKDWLASTIVHVNDKTFANKTKLSISIDKVITALKLREMTPTYYHFKYPTANRMLIARKSLVSGYTMRISYPSTFTYFDTSAYYEYDTEELTDVRGKCSARGNGGYGGSDWQNDFTRGYTGIFLNDTKIISQTVAFPDDSQQYADLTLDIESDIMNVFSFHPNAGNLAWDGSAGFSPRRCQTMAVVIVYRG